MQGARDGLAWLDHIGHELAIVNVWTRRRWRAYEFRGAVIPASYLYAALIRPHSIIRDYAPQHRVVFRLPGVGHASLNLLGGGEVATLHAHIPVSEISAWTIRNNS